MTKTIKYILSGALALSMASCNDFLDVKPVGKLIPTEVTEYENLLNNSNTIMRFLMDNNSGCCVAVYGDNLTLSESHIKYQFESTHPNLEILSAFLFYAPRFDPRNAQMWWSRGMWLPVGYFNNVIDGVASIDSEGEYAKGVIAQAKVGRAWIYMNAGQMYGPVYNPAGANDAKSLPIRTSGDPTVSNGPLCTVKEIMDFVKEDLDYACENAPVAVPNPCRASRATAYAMRAEYYMYMRDWNNMAADAKKAWELAVAAKGGVDNMIYNLNDFEYVDQEADIPEGVDPRVYAVLRGPDGSFDIPESKENLLYRPAPYQSAYNRYYLSDDYLANVPDKKKDLRFDLLILMDEAWSGEKYGNKFDDGLIYTDYRDQIYNNTQGLTHPLLLLTKAEAEVRSGDTGAALASLNLLRKYRYAGPDTDLANGGALTADQLLEEILNERRREQPSVSFQRVLDLKRYALDGNKPWVKKEIVHKAMGKEWKASIDSEFFNSLPIDNITIGYNPQWGLEVETRPFEPYNAW